MTRQLPPHPLPRGGAHRRDDALGSGSAEDVRRWVHSLGVMRAATSDWREGGDTASEVLRLDRAEEAQYVEGIPDEPEH